MSRNFPSRRDVFLGAGAIASVAVAPSIVSSAAPACPAEARVTRKNIDDLTASELATYEHAVKLLRANARSNSGAVVFHPLLRQATIADASGDGRQWRRGHLETIEARLRATDPARTADIVVPYWNFTQPVSGREYPRAFERAGSPLFAGASDGDPGHLDPVFWSYHAYIDTVWDRWGQTHGELAPGETAYLWIGPGNVEIRVGRAIAA